MIGLTIAAIIAAYFFAGILTCSLFYALGENIGDDTGEYIGIVLLWPIMLIIFFVSEILPIIIKKLGDWIGDHLINQEGKKK